VANGRAGYRLIEELIYYTPSGKFQVRMRLNTQYTQATFDTLAEAKRHREEVRAMRPHREVRRGKLDHSAHKTEERETVKDSLKKAPRTQVVIDDVEYTLVSLPDAPIKREKFLDTRDFRAVVSRD
jgi:hypothetical protein